MNGIAPKLSLRLVPLLAAFFHPYKLYSLPICHRNSVPGDLGRRRATTCSVMAFPSGLWKCDRLLISLVDRLPTKTLHYL